MQTRNRFEVVPERQPVVDAVIVRKVRYVPRVLLVG